MIPTLFSLFRWKLTSSSSRFYRDTTVLKQGHAALCRGQYQNQIVPGWTDPRGKCAVGFFEKLHRLDSYQVLVDQENSARLEWRPWDIFTKLPNGMVAYTTDDEHQYIAKYFDGKKYRYCCCYSLNAIVKICSLFLGLGKRK